MDDHRIKGKEYRYGKLEYEGDYLFDKKFTNGKGFDENVNKKYELINGNGIAITFYDDSSIYEGELKSGIRNGKGKVYYNGSLLYQGEFKNGKLNGKEKEFNKFGKLVYDGEYLNGKITGQGKLF